jgi:hypothetical protein
VNVGNNFDKIEMHGQNNYRIVGFQFGLQNFNLRKDTKELSVKLA